MTETAYEKNQRFNALVSWLHAFRYKTVLRIADELAASLAGRPMKVVEIGCAHAKLFSLLNERYDIDYVGIEPEHVSKSAALERHAEADNFKLIHDRAENVLGESTEADIIVALETLEHIPEHTVVRIVENIATLGPKVFVCSVPVEVGPAIWLKNLGSALMGYMRHTEYSWPETFWAGLGKLDKLPPHGTGHKGFDWRWLAQTIRHNMRIRETHTFPLNVLPASLSTSVFFVAEPRSQDW